MIHVVGLGPGGRDEMTPRAIAALSRCDVILGYETYIGLIRPVLPDKEMRSSSMKQEMDRCREALELARQGRTVGLVSSGDSGVYGMAGLMLEVAGGEVEVEVVPGVTAATSAAAVLGAPLMNDFAVVSLSDLMTPWAVIERRLEAAAAADFVICLYNPASHGRPEHFRSACNVILRHRSAETPAGWVRNIGREGQEHCVTTLGEICDMRLDMFCTAVIGCSTTHIQCGQMVTGRGYGMPKEGRS